jgi:hypothetical protein
LLSWGRWCSTLLLGRGGVEGGGRLVFREWEAKDRSKRSAHSVRGSVQARCGCSIHEASPPRSQSRDLRSGPPYSTKTAPLPSKPEKAAIPCRPPWSTPINLTQLLPACLTADSTSLLVVIAVARRSSAPLVLVLVAARERAESRTLPRSIRRKRVSASGARATSGDAAMGSKVVVACREFITRLLPEKKSWLIGEMKSGPTATASCLPDG